MRSIFYVIFMAILTAGLISCGQKQEAQQQTRQTQQTKAMTEEGCSSYSADNPACAGCGEAESEAGATADVQTTQVHQQAAITFIELGSVNCIPCKKMQPVMKSIETKYAGQLKVVFHDVWTEEGKPFASQYGIRIIPTQIFLDASGQEIKRHEGFFPEAEIDAFLQLRGLKAQ